ncbi:MAG: hypothetical protein H6R11_117 [Proteobacteria bacterium]|nr:hypothetical protein [Pseudomonadota bacterium]
MPHPAVRLVVWGVTAVSAQLLDPVPLALLTLMIAALAAAFAAPRLLRLLRRTRWLLLALVVLFVWATPGVLLFPDLGTLSPTADGLSLAWVHGARLIVILASLALLLEFTPTDEFVGALYGLMRPLSLLAVDRARIAVRLMLVMQYVESPPAMRWREWLQPSAHPTPPGRIVLKRMPLRMCDGIVVVLLALGACVALSA